MQQSVRDHRSRVTQLLLRKAFLELLGRKPMQSISIKELCELAGVSRGTFYAHYGDVAGLLRQIEDDMLEELRAALRPLLDPAITENPAGLAARVFEVVRNNSDLCTVTLGDYGDKQFTARILDLGWETCIDLYRNHFRNMPPRQLEYYYAFISGGLISLLRRWLDDGMAVGTEEFARQAVGFMLHGIDALDGGV